MALIRCEVTQEVVLACMTHAFTTENEEIMGLLLGDVREEEYGLVCRIWMAYPQIRTDRRKDRVETSPEQMARCTAHAERLTHETGVRVRVVGWYHSHPHITVLPSAVDVRTQALYQMLDPGFVGLIFSVFNTDTGTKAGQVQVTAFQSVRAGSPGAATIGGGVGSSGELVSYSSEALAGLDASTKQAIRESAAAAASQQQQDQTMVRKEVPLKITSHGMPQQSSLHDLVVVHRILAMEEQEAFVTACESLDAARPLNSTASCPTTTPSGVKKADNSAPKSSASLSKSASASLRVIQDTGRSLAQIHAACAYQQGLAELIESVSSASVLGLRSLLDEQAVRKTQLQHKIQQLQDMVVQRKQQLQDGDGDVSQRSTSHSACIDLIDAESSPPHSSSSPAGVTGDGSGPASTTSTNTYSHSHSHSHSQPSSALQAGTVGGGHGNMSQPGSSLTVSYPAQASGTQHHAAGVASGEMHTHNRAGGASSRYETMNGQAFAYPSGAAVMGMMQDIPSNLNTGYASAPGQRMYPGHGSSASANPSPSVVRMYDSLPSPGHNVHGAMFHSQGGRASSNSNSRGEISYSPPDSPPKLSQPPFVAQRRTHSEIEVVEAPAEQSKPQQQQTISRRTSSQGSIKLPQEQQQQSTHARVSSNGSSSTKGMMPPIPSPRRVDSDPNVMSQHVNNLQQVQAYRQQQQQQQHVRRMESPDSMYAQSGSHMQPRISPRMEPMGQSAWHAGAYAVHGAAVPGGMMHPQMMPMHGGGGYPMQGPMMMQRGSVPYGSMASPGRAGHVSPSTMGMYPMQAMSPHAAYAASGQIQGGAMSGMPAGRQAARTSSNGSSGGGSSGSRSLPQGSDGRYNQALHAAASSQSRPESRQSRD